MRHSKEYIKRYCNEIETFSFTRPFKDDRIRNLLMDMVMRNYGTYEIKKYERDEVRLYGKHFMNLSFEELTWFKLCDIANSTKRKHFSFVVLSCLIERDDWSDEYKDCFSIFIPTIRKVIEMNAEKRHRGEAVKTMAAQELFCYGDVRRMICFVNTKHDYFGTLIVKTDNQALRSLMQGFFDRKQASTVVDFRTIEEKYGLIAKAFSEFIPDFSLSSDISEAIFWKQVHYVMGIRNNRSLYLSYLFKFYIYLMEGPMPHLFQHSDVVNHHFFRNESTIRYIRQGYCFAVLDMDVLDSIRDKEKIVFILKGYDRRSNTVAPYDFKAFDCSSLEDRHYLPIFWEYAVSTTINRNINFDYHDHMVIDALNTITRMKRQPGYENPDPFHIMRIECLAIKAETEKTTTSLTRRYQQINEAKNFLAYCDETGLLHFEKQALRRLQNEWKKHYDDPNRTLSDEEILAIFHALKEESRTDLRAMLILAMVMILLDTEFRISMICALRTTDLVQGAKPGEWYIRKIAKTSREKTLEYVITKGTADILLECIEDTKTIRETIDNPLLSDSIFIYYSESERQFRRMSKYGFVWNLNKILKKHGIIEKYTSTLFRNTHMTRALQYCVEHGMSDLEKGLLTKHKRIGTTLAHYYDSSDAFREQLEDTYDIEISPELTIPGEVVEEPQVSNEEASVEHGCGTCTSPHCLMKSNLPCLLCKSFVTTPEHEPFFENAIQAISEKIRNTNDEHLVEDLKTRKSIMVLYLEKIHQYREEHRK